MTRDTRIALILMGELVVALHANASDAFKCWLYGRQLNLEEPVFEELLDWLYSFLTAEEQDRLTGWHLGVKL